MHKTNEHNSRAPSQLSSFSLVLSVILSLHLVLEARSVSLQYGHFVYKTNVQLLHVVRKAQAPSSKLVAFTTWVRYLRQNH